MTDRPLREHARGQWPMILRELGIPEASLRRKYVPCPGCGGRDRFSFLDRDGLGTFFCRGGGNPTGGDGFALLEHVYGWRFAEAAQRVERVLGITPSPQPGKRRTGRLSADAREWAQLFTLLYETDRERGITHSDADAEKYRRCKRALRADHDERTRQSR